MATEKNINTAQTDFHNDMMEVEKAENERRKVYSTEANKTKDKTTRRRMITGAIFCVFALIGVMSVISGVFKTGVKILDNEAEKQEYNALLSTFVMYDPLPFETPDQADQKVLLSSSVWTAIMNEDMTMYETDEYGQPLLPAIDVDKYFSRIFGTNISLAHATFSDQDVEFKFDEEKKVYAIPATNFPTGFTPQVEKIKTSFTEKIVTVGYLSPSTSWADTGEKTVSKYMDYIFEKQDGQFCLVAVRESSMKVELPQTTEEAK